MPRRAKPPRSPRTARKPAARKPAQPRKPASAAREAQAGRQARRLRQRARSTPKPAAASASPRASRSTSPARPAQEAAPDGESAVRLRQGVPEVMDRIFTLMSEDPDMGPKLRDADVPAALRVRRRRPRRQHPRGAGGRGGQPALGVERRRRLGAQGRMTMSSETANKYFQGKENVAIAIARRRIKTGGDVKAALALIPITKPVYAHYRASSRREYPHLRSERRRLTRASVRASRPPSPNKVIGREVRGLSPSQGAAARRAPPADAAGRIARMRRDHDRGPAAFIFGAGRVTDADARRRRRASSASRPPRCGAGSHDGLVPQRDGRWTPRRGRARADRRAPARARALARGDPRGDASPAGSPSATSRTCSRRARRTLHARGGGGARPGSSRR